MKFKPTLITEASGSMGGLTFSHNTFGAYVRHRVIPTNPNSQDQVAIRLLMPLANAAWLVLPQATKDAWNAYAYGTPIKDKIGASIRIPGRLMFMRDFILRGQAGMIPPPVVVAHMGLADLSPCTIAITAPTTGSLTFDNGDPWATTTGGFLRLFVSRGKGQGVTFCKGPYLQAANVTGATPVPPTSPKAFTMPWAVQAGQKVFGRVIATDAEGRLSAEQFLVDLSVA